MKTNRWFWVPGLALLALSSPAFAQTVDPAPSGVVFLPDFDFHMDAQHLRSGSEQFTWDANFGGELDLFRWNGGEATFEANYEVVMGDERRHFDPHSGNYTLAGLASGRIGGLVVSPMFHHVSRHLADRPKEEAIDWNSIGFRVEKHAARGGLELDGRNDFRLVVFKSRVDYNWELDSRIDTIYHMRPRVGLISAFGLRIVGVDGSRNRGTQTGVRAEGGVRLGGENGRMDFYVAGERRIDPYPLEFNTRSWLTFGFRLMSQ